MDATTSTHKHEFALTVAGVSLKVTVESRDGDPALARDFADQLAQVVEERFVDLGRVGAGEPQMAEVVMFPLQGAQH